MIIGMVKRRLGLALAFALVVGALISVNIAQRSAVAADPSPLLGRVSATSLAPASLSGADLRMLAQLQAGSGQIAGTPKLSLGTVSTIAAHDGRAYYRVANSLGPDCYAVGYVTGSADHIGQVLCSAEFPSATRPVLDFTVMQQGGSVWREEGIAADGVSTIAFEDPSGNLVDRTPVVNNTYFVAPLPDGPVNSLVGLDSTGNIVWSRSIGGP
jgi:hypothetical protein